MFMYFLPHIIVGVLAGCLIGTFIIVGTNLSRKGIIIGILVGLACIGLAIGVGFFTLQSQSGQRALKSTESEWENGITRTVTVYDATGNELTSYTGTFDVTYDDATGRVMFDDIDTGKRHIIYFKTGTVTVDEL